MIMAFIVWMLSKMGVEATPEQFLAYERAFLERGHHLTVTFAGTRFDGSRWTGDNFEKLITVGLGYEYIVARKYNGVGLEVEAQSLGAILRPNKDRHEFIVSGGLAYYPITHLRIFMHAGPDILDTGKVSALGRVGVGYRIMFFKVGVQPVAYFQANTADVWSWVLGARFEY